MKITAVNCHVLLDPGYDVEATSSNQDTIVVEIETDEGVVGIGETDLNAWVARACIEAPGTHTMDRGLKTMLIGRDPTDPAALWDELYVGTAMTGRRGALVHALGAIDMALWDIAGKAAGVPSWRLLGEQRPESRLVPYASLLPNAGSDWEEFADALGGQAIEALQARVPGGQARAAHARALPPHRAVGARREARRRDRGRAPRHRSGVRDHGRRRLRVGRLARGARGRRDVGRARRVLHRDAALERRPRGVRRAGEALAGAGRRR